MTNAQPEDESPRHSTFEPGDRVEHHRFGHGKVVAATLSQACVQFDQHGAKMIVPAFLRPSSKAAPIADNDNHPVDPWAESAHPSLPSGLLPPIIEEFARKRAEQMGVDPGGLAVIALAVCAATITDDIKLKVKVHDDWTERACFWGVIVGGPSVKKTPQINAAAKPLRAIDDDYQRQHREEMAAWDALPKETKAVKPKPVAKRVRISDATTEKVGEILKDNTGGLLLDRDELTGWFGAMEKYSSGKGAGADRAFWLQAFNGGSHSVDRISRGAIWVPNLSVSMIGGIQPGPMRTIMQGKDDDGLIQRFTPIMVGPSGDGSDAPAGPVVPMYEALVKRLHALRPPTGGTVPVRQQLRFDEGAQAIFVEVCRKNGALQRAWEKVNAKLAMHVGKYDGLFGRLCVLWHCIESSDTDLPTIVTEGTARRVAQFLHGYLLQHAIAFYRDVVGLADDQDMVLAVANWILAKGMKTVTVSDARRGDRVRSSMDERQAAQVLSRLDALGWLTPLPLEKNQTSPRYEVNPLVFDLFEERAEAEATRREEIRRLIAEVATRAGT